MLTGQLKVTIDTNIFPIDDILLRLKKSKFPIEFKIVSVTVRELKNHKLANQIAEFTKIHESGVWDESTWDNAVWGGTLIEVAVLDESSVGSAILGSTTDAEVFEDLLLLISNNTFPASGKRYSLTRGQRRQLRDAMILTAHLREKRDILVTNDIKGFIGVKGDKRDQIESKYKTKIMTKEEFIKYLIS